MAVLWELCCVVCCFVCRRRSPSDIHHRSWRWGACRLLVLSWTSDHPNGRSSYVITFFFMMITASVLAEVCSALPAAGSIYLYIQFQPVSDPFTVGQLNLVVPNTVACSVSSLHGGHPLPGPPSVHLTHKEQPITFFPKSMHSISHSPPMSITSISELFNGLSLKLSWR